MPDDDPIRKAWARDLALVALKEMPLFRNASWRLLRDFVDAVGTATFVDTSVPANDAQLLVVAGGRVRVTPLGGFRPTAFDPGVHLLAHEALQGRVQIESAGRLPVAVFWVGRGHWSVIGDSPALARSLSLAHGISANLAPGPSANLLAEDILALLGDLVGGAQAEFVWVGCAHRLEPLLTPLLQLVAAGLARMSPHPVRTVSLGEGGRHRIADWREPRNPVLSLADDEQLHRILSSRREAAHVLLHRPCRPLEASEQLARASVDLHRILLLHEGAMPAIPRALYQLLPGRLTLGLADPTPAAGGRFSSVVSAAIRPPRLPTPRDEGTPELPGGGTPGGELRAIVRGLHERAVQLLDQRRHFAARPVGDEARGPLARNTFRAELHLEALDREWQRWRRERPTGEVPNEARFVVDLVENDDYRRGADRLARGAFNRQVGVAVGGGGASAFRVAPLLDLLETGDRPVPIDYLAGVSGGALVGAYYCALGVPGLQRLLAKAGRMAWMVPLLSITSWPLEAWIDLDLEGSRIEDLDAPAFLPVAMELAGKAPPRAVVLAAGSLGEAVRASGALPPVFAPTDKNGRRYGDGAAAALIPVQMLDQADTILACNVIPGPKHSNPWYDSEPVVLAHRYTLVGRAIDLWIWAAMLMQNAAASAARGADAYLWFDPQRYPSLETVDWGRAKAVAGAARDDSHLTQAARDIDEAWRRLDTSSP